MKIAIAALVLCLALPAAQAEKPEETSLAPTGRVELFNGRDLGGWVFKLKDADALPTDIWEVREGVIYCKGHVFGYMRTEKAYADYTLTLEWRWPETPGNSGVFLHITGEDKVWPMNIEAQLKHGDVGALLALGGSASDQTRASGNRTVPRSGDDVERPAGEWNTMKVRARGDTLEVIANGIPLNTFTGVGARSGFIGLQSEGAPIEFRNVAVEPLD